MSKLWKNIKTEKADPRKSEQSSIPKSQSSGFPTPVASNRKPSGKYSEVLIPNIQRQTNSPFYSSCTPENNDHLQGSITQNNEQLPQIDLHLDHRHHQSIKIAGEGEEEIQGVQQEQIIEAVDFEDIKFEQQQLIMISSKAEDTKKRIVIEKLKQIKTKVHEVVLSKNGVLKKIQKDKKDFKIWVQQIIHQKFAYNLVMAMKKLDANANFDQYVCNLEGQINQMKSSNQTMLEILSKQVEQKSSEVKNLQLQLEITQNLNLELQKQLETTKQENSALLQQIFQFQQKIAQIDLQIQEKVKEIVSKKDSSHISEKGRTVDRTLYVQQIRQFEQQIRELQERCLSKSESQSQINYFKDVQEQLNFREESIKQQEIELDEIMRDLQKRRKEVESFHEQIIAKQQKLKYQEIKLLKRSEALSQRQTKLALEETRKSQLKSKESENLRHYRNQEFHNKYHKLKDEPSTEIFSNRKQIYNTTKRSSKDIDMHYHNKNFPLPPQPRIPHETISRSHSREINIQQRSEISKTKNRLSRMSSNSQKGNDRLHDLGSKLQRLREQIKKQINEAR